MTRKTIMELLRERQRTEQTEQTETHEQRTARFEREEEQRHETAILNSFEHVKYLPLHLRARIIAMAGHDALKYELGYSLYGGGIGQDGLATFLIDFLSENVMGVGGHLKAYLEEEHQAYVQQWGEDIPPSIQQYIDDKRAKMDKIFSVPPPIEMNGWVPKVSGKRRTVDELLNSKPD